MFSVRSPKPCATLAVVTATPDIPGLRIAGIIGEGGFATVYRGWQVAVGREVAVKIDNRVLVSERDRRRFVREVTAAGRLSGHPHVIDIYDAGTLDDGRPYMVMEFCPGGSLADAIRSNGVMNPAQVRDIGIKIADALAAAHAAGVLHRDVKPANILVNRYGMVGLSDFGLASILDPGAEQSVTREALTPAYSSPERFRGEEPTAACDLYSLAATMYSLLAGRPPRFPADGGVPSVATLVSLHGKPVDDIPGVPSALMATLHRSLAAEPAMRPQSAVELRDELIAAPQSQSRPEPQQSWSRPQPQRGARTVTVTQAESTAGEPAVRSALAADSARHARRPLPAASGRRPMSRLAAAIALMAMTAAVIVVYSLQTRPQRTTPQPARAGDPKASVVTRQAADLKGRVGNSKYFTGCDVPAQPTAGAEATINCQAREPGITVSASSFTVTGVAIPFVPSNIPSESEGLNTFLKATIPNSLPVNPASNASLCSPNGGTSCPDVGFSGYWGGGDVTIGRLYCYEQAGLYYIVWTFDNDSYEASYNEDFAVVASGRNLEYLINWWNQTPV
jgi:tRNA A-37 threonylcarbamoyl transferase component Bud32